MALALTVGGCSSNDALKKQISGLETQLTAMRADQDRLDERLAAVELSSTVPSRAAAPPPPRVDHPRLKVIHLAPEDDEQPTPEASPVPAAVAEPAGKRPIIRGTGERVIKLGDADPRDDEAAARDSAPVKPVAMAREGRRN